MTTADEGLQRFSEIQAELVAWSQSGINEADTRAKILDRLLKDVLGWDESSIRREERSADGDYLDYHLESPSNRFIMEAKRVGIYFEMPASSSIRARRSGIVAKSTSLYNALEQARSYCVSQGIPVAAVSNGVQLAVSLAFTPHSSSGYDTVLFDGPERILSNFVLFWNLLAAEGDCEKFLNRLLVSPESIRSAPQAPQRLLDRLPLPDEIMNRNPIDLAMAPLIAHYFSDLIGRDKLDVLREAYVESTRQAQYGKQIDALLADTVPRLGIPIVELTTMKRSAPEIDKAITQASRARNDAEGSVLLLVGGVGAGKTTFARRYFNFLIDAKLKGSVIPTFLDFTKTTDEASSLSDFTDRSVLEQLTDTCPDLELGSWDTLLQIYEREISSLRNGVLAPYWRNDRQRFEELVSEQLRSNLAQTELHVGRLIEYLITHAGREPCVVFDNVDQLSQDIQRKAINLAFQKCRVWGCLGVLAVREETYWRFRNTPPLDAYHRYTFHVSAPRFANVLSKRLELARRDRGEIQVTVESRSGKEFQDISLGEFLQIIVQSFLGRDHRNIMLLEALSANDVRSALDMFSVFLLSGHTNTDEYIKTYIAARSYTVPFHHVLKGIAFAERRYYDSAKSIIDNLFSIEDDGFYSHFQKIRLLRYLRLAKNIDSVPGRGFVSVARLFEAFQALISDEEGLRRLLDSLLTHRLVESANGYRVQGAGADLVRITSAGEYYLDVLIFEFAYLDLASGDTAVKSSIWFDQLVGAGVSQGSLIATIRDRLVKVGLFLRYLEEQEREELGYMANSGLEDPVIAPVMGPILEVFRRASRRIKRQARKYGRDLPRAEG
jgi:hypothetical protein